MIAVATLQLDTASGQKAHLAKHPESNKPAARRSAPLSAGSIKQEILMRHMGAVP